jgi:hypothetical protein
MSNTLIDSRAGQRRVTDTVAAAHARLREAQSARGTCSGGAERVGGEDLLVECCTE